MHDACHRLKFWHPSMPALTGNSQFLKLFQLVEVDFYYPIKLHIRALWTLIFMYITKLSFS
jgi:hypothetical protein